MTTTTFDERYDAAKSTIDAHNAAVDKRGRGIKMDWEAFDSNLFDRGYTTVAALKRITVEELIQRWDVPEGLAHVLTDILNPDATSTTPTAPVVHTTAASPPHGGGHVRFENPPPVQPPSIFGQTVTVMSRAEQVEALPIEQIVANYDPHDPDNVFGATLIKKVRIARCVVFNDDGTVNRTATTKLVEEILARKPERKTWTDATGAVHAVYRVSELPVGEDMVRVCAIHRCELRDDGECTGHDESWAGVPEIAEQLFALGMETRDQAVTLVAGNKMELGRMLMLLQGKSDEDVLKTFASLLSKPLIVEYNNRKVTHQALPLLRVPRSQLGSVQGGARGGPFGGSGSSILSAGGGASAANDPNGPIDLSKPLSVQNVGALSKALQSAFPNVNALDELMTYGMGVSLDTVVEAMAYQYVPGKVVAWVISQGRLVELINAASKVNPGNPDLKAFVARCKASESKTWDRPRIIKLRALMVRLYSDKARSKMLVDDIQLDTSTLDFDGGPQTWWHKILEFVGNHNALDKLVERAKGDYPGAFQEEGF